MKNRDRKSGTKLKQRGRNETERGYRRVDNKKVKTAVVGCGAISDIYISNMMKKYANLDVTACCAKHMESAVRKANQYGIRACTYEEILADSSIEMVVILTPAATHYELALQALQAGKHVYTEKTMTIQLKEAAYLIKLAEEKGLYLGSAPETFLGSCFQTAKTAIEEGLIGEVTSFQISGNRDLNLLASIFSFMRMPGGGVCFDYGVYYLTALVSLLGAIDQVFAVVGNRSRVRTNVFPESPDYGKEYIYDNESQVTAVMRLESGVTGSFALNGDSNLEDIGEFIIYGTKGILRLGDADHFGHDVILIPNRYDFEKPNVEKERILPKISLLSDNCRGIGPSEMARAIRGGTKNRASKEMAYHVLDSICQMIKSGETGKMEKVESTCKCPETFVDWEELLK